MTVDISQNITEEDDCFECLDLSQEEDLQYWIQNSLLSSVLDQSFQLISFKNYVEKFTRNSYLKFRVKNWRKGWEKFLVYIESDLFHQKICQYLLTKKFTTVYIDNVFAEYKQNFIETVRGEDTQAEKLSN